jgi:aminomethyltransferase
MGEFLVTGPDREKFLHYATVNDVMSLVPGQVQYSCMCKPDGGIVDDLLVYKFADRMMVVVNAANLDKDWNWLKSVARGDVRLENKSDEFSLLAVQGRNAADILKTLTRTDISKIKYYHFEEGEALGHKAIISRTGYTGEDGFELYIGNDAAVPIWRAILEAGKPYQIEPIGLGARDSLRLEMKMCLYGNDIDETTNPLEAGLGWITKLSKADFVGKSTIEKVKEAGLTRKLVAIEVDGNAFPRQHYPIEDVNGNKIGEVTSGTVSPVLNKGIALGYVPVAMSEIGTPLAISCHGKPTPAKIVKPPFYTRPY